MFQNAPLISERRECTQLNTWKIAENISIIQKSIDLQINMFDDGITTKCVFCPYGKVLAGNGQTYLMFDSSSIL